MRQLQLVLPFTDEKTKSLAKVTQLISNKSHGLILVWFQSSNFKPLAYTIYTIYTHTHIHIHTYTKSIVVSIDDSTQSSC